MNTTTTSNSSSSSNDDKTPITVVEPNTPEALAEPLLPAETPAESSATSSTVVALESSHIERVTLDNELLVPDEGGDWERGESQPPACRNWFFAFLFLVQLGLILTFSILGIVSCFRTIHWNRNDDNGGNNGNDDDDDDDYSELMKDLGETVQFVTLLMASVLSASVGMVLLIFGPLVEMMIQVSLVSSPTMMGISAITCLIMGEGVAAAGFGIGMAIGIWYAVRIWRRIPFAAANVATAMAAINANRGILPLAYVVTFLASIWTLLFGMAVFYIIVDHSEWVLKCHSDSDDGSHTTPPSDGYFDDDEDCHVSPQGKAVFVGMVLSFYWTSQVLSNIFHTTVAGVVGTWWFTPPDERVVNDRGCCGWNTAIADAWSRSSIWSLGSICLGSLLVAILQVLQLLVELAKNQNNNDGRQRQQRDNSLLWCLLKCFIDQLERLLEYINQWAFIYVGLYGYDYWEAGSKVYNLFRARGWSVILNDHLVGRSLGLMSIFIGMVSALIGAALGFFMIVGPVTGGFIGFAMGLFFSSILLKVVTSATDTVIVCFAEAPTPFQLYEPELSRKMIQAWRTAYPNDCGF